MQLTVILGDLSWSRLFRFPKAQDLLEWNSPEPETNLPLLPIATPWELGCGLTHLRRLGPKSPFAPQGVAWNPNNYSETSRQDRVNRLAVWDDG